MRLELQPRTSLAGRILSRWRDRSAVIQAAAVTGTVTGTLSLVAAALSARPGTGMVAVVLPAFLGSVAGLLTLSTLHAVRVSPTRTLDAADWAQRIASSAFVLFMAITKVVPRMQTGGGYAMLGVALIASAAVVFWQLPKSALRQEAAWERPDGSD